MDKKQIKKKQSLAKASLDILKKKYDGRRTKDNAQGGRANKRQGTAKGK